MMEATDSGQSDDMGLRRRSMLGRSPHWGILQLAVDSVGVVVLDGFAEKALEVLLVQHDHVIEQFPTSTPDPSRGDPILPRTSERRPPRLDSKRRA